MWQMSLALFYIVLSRDSMYFIPIISSHFPKSDPRRWSRSAFLFSQPGRSVGLSSSYWSRESDPRRWSLSAFLVSQSGRSVGSFLISSKPDPRRLFVETSTNQLSPDFLDPYLRGGFSSRNHSCSELRLGLLLLFMDQEYSCAILYCYLIKSNFDLQNKTHFLSLGSLSAIASWLRLKGSAPFKLVPRIACIRQVDARQLPNCTHR